MERKKVEKEKELRDHNNYNQRLLMGHNVQNSKQHHRAPNVDAICI